MTALPGRDHHQRAIQIGKIIDDPKARRMDVLKRVLALSGRLATKERLVGARSFVGDVEDQAQGPEKAEGDMALHRQMRLAPAPGQIGRAAGKESEARLAS